MSKRPLPIPSSQAATSAPNVKRSHKAAGFHLARPPTPPTTSPSQASSYTTSSVFVTVAHNEGRRGFQAQSRVIPGDLEILEPIQTTTGFSVSNSDFQDIGHDIPLGFFLDEPESHPSDTHNATNKSEPMRRKRLTTNYVHRSNLY